MYFVKYYEFRNSLFILLFSEDISSLPYPWCIHYPNEMSRHTSAYLDQVYSLSLGATRTAALGALTRNFIYPTPPSVVVTTPLHYHHSISPVSSERSSSGKRER